MAVKEDGGANPITMTPLLWRILLTKTVVAVKRVLRRVIILLLPLGLGLGMDTGGIRAAMGESDE